MRLDLFSPQKVFEFKKPTTIVQWLVRLIAGDVPPVDKVNFIPAFTVDLYRAAKRYGIERPKRWLHEC